MMKFKLQQMENKIGEKVIFTKDLHCAFSPENVEQLRVYSLSVKEFDNCEIWSDDNETKFFKIADFNVELNNKGSRFFYGEPVDYGFFTYKPEKLYFLPVGTTGLPEVFIKIGSKDFEQSYPVPKSMWDFGNFIDNFLFHVMRSRLYLLHEHASFYEKRMETAKTKNNNDLPF